MYVDREVAVPLLCEQDMAERIAASRYTCGGIVFLGGLQTRMTNILIASIVVLSVAMMLARPRSIPEVYWVGGGALLLVLLRLEPLKAAGNAIGKGLDVYLFLIGMMLVSELAREQGVFDWVSSVALEKACGSSLRLFTLVYGIGTLVTIFMSNDATAVVLTPAILTAMKKAKVAPLPHLFACALIANAASFVLPVSNPANLVVFQHGMPALGRWLMLFGLPSILSISATYGVIRLMFREELGIAIRGEVEVSPLTRNGKIVLWGLGMMAAILLITSAFNKNLGMPTCLAALALTAVVCGTSRKNPRGLLGGISWGTLVLVAGLFVLVDAVERIGLLRVTGSAMHWVQGCTPAVGVLIAGFVVALGNNVVNNLPLGLVAGATLQDANVHGVLASAVLIGVDLGPNLSITGSLATILWLIALRREGLDVSFMTFFKVGMVAMPVALVSAFGGVLLLNHLVR